MARSTTSAERMRRYRRRRRQGLLVVRGEVGAEVLNALVTKGWLTADEAQKPDAVGKALSRLAEGWTQDTQKIRCA